MVLFSLLITLSVACVTAAGLLPVVGTEEREMLA